MMLKMSTSSSLKASFAFWFALGFACVAVLQVSHAHATGGIGGLLKVGQDHPLADMIMTEIPETPVAPGLGHDGQINFAIATDLTGDRVPDLMESMEAVGYRYRRIGFPALSGLFGQLNGVGLVWGMAVLNAAAAGLAAAATAAIAQHFQRTQWVAIAVILNPGVWLSALLLTADNLALATGLLAILAFLKGRLVWAIVGLIVAVLTKEAALAFTVGLAGYAWTATGDRRTAGWLAAGSLLPLGAWLLFVQARIGDSFGAGGGLDLPLRGLIHAAGAWPQQSPQNKLFTTVTLFFLVLGVVGLARRRELWRWLIWPWIGVALISSRFIWIFGNNSIRVFAPLIVLTVLALSDERTEGRIGRLSRLQGVRELRASVAASRRSL